MSINNNNNDTTIPTWEQLINTAPRFLTNHLGKTVADKFMAYCKEEEFDDVALVIDDIESWDDSSIIEFIAVDLNWTDEQRQKLWTKLRILCQLEDAGIVLPDDLNFKLTDEDVLNAKRYMDEQCPGMFGSGKDKVLLQAIATGLKNDIPLLPLIYDVYLKYKLEQSLLQKDKKNKQTITPHDWETSSKYLSQHQAQFKDIISAVTNYQARMFNPLMLTPFTKFTDSLSEFVNLSIQACNMIHQLIQTNHPLPLQIDVWIIPEGKSEASFEICGDETDDDEYDDDDDDDPDDDCKDANDISNRDLGKVENLLNYGKIKFEIDSINLSDSSCQRIMKQQLDKVLLNKRNTRAVMILDRRDNNKKGKKGKGKGKSKKPKPNANAIANTKSKILTYIPPAKYSKISPNYCQEQMIFHTLKFICPSQDDVDDIKNGNVDNKNPYAGKSGLGKKSINGGNEANGRMFCLSFHIHSKEHVNCYWYVHGWGARFWPQYFTDIWPRFFKNNDLKQNKIDSNYVKKHMKLKLNDKLFNAWDDIINVEK